MSFARSVTSADERSLGTWPLPLCPLHRANSIDVKVEIQDAIPLALDARPAQLPGVRNAR